MPALGLGGMSLNRLYAKHKRHNPVFAAMRRVRNADGDAIAQNRGAITERSHLGHAMRNENYRISTLAPPPSDCEDTFRQIGRKSRRDLVQHEHDRIGRERARQIDEPQSRIGNAARELAEFEIGCSKIIQMAAHAVEGDTGQAHVLSDCQIGNKRWILIDGDDARSTGFCG